MEQILLHFFGDYILQNDHVGIRKKEKSLKGIIYCLFHCLVYALPFLLIASWEAVIMIAFGHFIIDRWNFVGNFIAFKNNRYLDSHESVTKKKLDTTNFGYDSKRPFAITVWLYIIQDNVLHLIWNYLVILLLS